MPIYKDGKLKNEDGLQKYKVRINYQDAKGTNRQLTRTVYGLQQAKQLELFLIAEKESKDKNIRFEDVLSAYMDYKKFLIRETTFEKKKTVFKCHITPFFANVKVKNIDTKLLSDWISYMNKKELGVLTKRKAYAELNALLIWCVKNDYIGKNPLDNLDNFKDVYNPHDSNTIHYYTASEFKLFISAAKNYADARNDYDYYVFFTIAYYTGMRKGEIKALKWSDLCDNKITVSRSISAPINGKLIESPPKTKSSYRTFTCPRALIEVLNEQMKRHKGLSDNINDFRICGGYKTISDNAINKHNVKYGKEACLHHIRIHDFRHSHATLLANNGINIQEIARRLGHSNVQETWNTYSHLYPQAEELAITVLDSI